MRRLKVWLAVVLFLAVGAHANAQGVSGTILWDTGNNYPKTGTNSGEIAIQGSITLDKGSSLSGSTVTVIAWLNGSDDRTATISITTMGCSNTFSGVISGLPSSAGYNVTVEVSVVNTGLTSTIRTEPGVATAN